MKKTAALGVGFEPIEAQFDGGSFAESAAKLRSHPAGGRLRNDGTNTSYSLAEQTHSDPRDGNRRGIGGN
jgi:hypothetical protein